MFFCPASLTWLQQSPFIADAIAHVFDRSCLSCTSFSAWFEKLTYIAMCYQFEILLKILPKLNSLHAPNNEHLQLVGKTLLKCLERLFLSRTWNSLHHCLDQSFFPRASLETSDETRLYLLKLYLSNLTDLSYQYMVPSNYRLLNTLQLCSTDFLSIYRWFRPQLLQSKKHL